MTEKLKCSVCSHEWIARSDKKPLKCPNGKCQSFDWDLPQDIKIDMPPKAEPIIKKEIDLPD